MIENWLKSVFKKVSAQKINITIHSPNSIKIWRG